MTKPRKILIIRLQAIGDVVITFPWIQNLHRMYPAAIIHFVTREECAPLPALLDSVARVWRLSGERSGWRQLLAAVPLAMRLRKEKYDCAIDLQNNKVSRWLLRFMGVRPAAGFDTHSRKPAAIRVQETLVRAGFPGSTPDYLLGVRMRNAHYPVDAILPSNTKYIVLNPAGAFSSRQWPDENYVKLAHLLMGRFPNVVFVLVGLDKMKDRSHWLAAGLGERCIDLCGKTTIDEAFRIAGGALLVVSEDSGLMHMAWVQGVPVVALFGSSPAYWSAPFGETSYCFHSGDLPCGNCFKEVCQFGDNRCLTRITPAQVSDVAIRMMNLRE